MRVLKIGLAYAVMSMFIGCSSDNPDDPFEPFNRTVFSFNDTLDHYVAEPVAKGYVYVTHPDLRHMITNFFNNLSEHLRALNDLLQLNYVEA